MRTPFLTSSRMRAAMSSLVCCVLKSLPLMRAKLRTERFRRHADKGQHDDRSDNAHRSALRCRCGTDAGANRTADNGARQDADTSDRTDRRA